MFLCFSRKEENSIIGIRILTRGRGGGGGGRGGGVFMQRVEVGEKKKKHVNLFSIKLSLPRVLGATSGVRPLYRNGVA